MELDELEVDQPRPGRRGERQAVAGRLGWVGREAVELAEAAGGEHDLRRLVQNEPSVGVAGEDADDARARRSARPSGSDHELGGERPFEERTHGAVRTRSASARTSSAPVESPWAWRIRRRLCAASRPKSSSPLAERSNSAPSSISRRIGDHALFRQQLRDHGIDQTGAGRHRVGGVELRRVAGAHRHGDPALRPEARARRERRLGEQVHALAGELERAGESRDAGADHHDVGGAALDGTRRRGRRSSLGPSRHLEHALDGATGAHARSPARPRRDARASRGCAGSSAA